MILSVPGQGFEFFDKDLQNSPRELHDFYDDPLVSPIPASIKALTKKKAIFNQDNSRIHARNVGSYKNAAPISVLKGGH